MSIGAMILDAFLERENKKKVLLPCTSKNQQNSYRFSLYRERKLRKLDNEIGIGTKTAEGQFFVSLFYPTQSFTFIEDESKEMTDEILRVAPAKRLIKTFLQDFYAGRLESDFFTIESIKAHLINVLKEKDITEETANSLYDEVRQEMKLD